MKVELGHFCALISASLAGGSFMLPYLITPNFGGWAFKNYPRLLIDINGDVLFLLPVVVASILQLEIFFALFISHNTRKYVNRALGLITLAIGGLLTFASFKLQDIFFNLFFAGLVENVQVGYSAHLMALSYIFLTLSGLLLILYPLSTSTQKVQLEDTPKEETNQSPASDSIRNRKPSKPSTSSSTSPKFKTVTIPTRPSRLSAFNGLFLFFLLFGSFSALKWKLNEISTCSLSPLDLQFSEDGFKVDVYLENIKEPRSLVQGSKALFVSTRKLGSLYAVYDHNNDFKADEIITFSTGMNQPNGIAMKNGDLYVAEISRLWRYKNIESVLETATGVTTNSSGIRHKTVKIEGELLYDKFPTETHHGWKYLAFGPDGLLYVPVGSPCNVCLRPDDERYATIMRQKTVEDWNEWEIVAHGVRNTVGFDWHPVTGELWFTDNGRDFMDHDLPPDEFNRVKKIGSSFGFPYCYGYNHRDQEILANETIDCKKFERAEMELAAHAAALGVKFYKGNMFPLNYQNSALIAEHGSWNRVPPSGYRLSIVKFNANNDPYDVDEFLGGFIKTLPGNFISNVEGCGRPVDLLELSDGSVLFSDDFGNKIWRITYEEPAVVFE